MSGVIVFMVIAALVVVGLAVGVWLVDARRNKDVEHEEERFEPDPAEKDSPR